MRVIVVGTISGGKDSLLASIKAQEYATEHRYPFKALFIDTGWEHPQTYRYLRETIIPFFGQENFVWIKTIGMQRLIYQKKIFPSIRRRFCTQYLKIFPMRDFLKELSQNHEVAELWLGVRRDESYSRADTPNQIIFEKGDRDGYFTVPLKVIKKYPIADYSTLDVFRELEEKGIPVNPLYNMGHIRVGCYPCMISEKSIKQVIYSAIVEKDQFAIKRLHDIALLDFSIRKAKLTPLHTLRELINEVRDKHINHPQLQLFP